MFSRRRLFWTVFLVACVLFAALKNWQNTRFQLAQQQQQSELQETQARNRKAANQAFNEMNRLLTPGLGRGPQHPAWTKEDLEAQLPGNSRLELMPDASKTSQLTAQWTHPNAPIELEFRFGDDKRLSGWAMTNARPRNQPSPVSRATFEDAGEQFRRAVGKYVRWVWFVLFFGWMATPSRRQLIGDCLLAIAISFTVADAVAPNYTLFHIFSNDIVFIDAVLLAISCAAVTATSPTLRSFVSRRLLSRQFSIRWMMGVTALIAVLVFLGWHGKVIGAVIAVAAMSYGLMALVHRPQPARDLSNSAVEKPAKTGQ